MSKTAPLERIMMTDITLSSTIDVSLIRHVGGDDSVVQAAQVSALGMNSPETDMPRLISALMKDRHGSPFEHNSFTFFVAAPLFVFREWQRHRIGSFNEMSGRYTELKPRFYTPDENRKMQNVGTKMRPDFVRGTPEQQRHMLSRKALKIEAWEQYQKALALGIANELARIDLPLSIYSEMYWTVNARSLMNFLSLRVESDASLVRSYPQREIAMGAEQVEDIFHDWMPLTHNAFVNNGRVAP